MRILVDRKTLSEAVNLAARVTAKKRDVSILQNVHFEVKNNEVTLTATDAETTLRTSIALHVMKGDGQFCVSAKELKAMLAGASGETVALEATEDGCFTLEYSNGVFICPATGADEFPETKQEEMTERVQLPGLLIRDALKRSLWSVSDDELRIALMGVCFTLRRPGILDIVTTNAQVLVLSRIRLSYSTGSEFRFIIPKKAAMLLQRVLSDEPVDLSWNDQSCRVKVGPYTFDIRNIDARFPDYDKVIPNAIPLQALVPRDTVLRSLKRLLPFSDDKFGRVNLSFSNGTLKMSADDFENMRGARQTIAIAHESDDAKICVSGRRLAGILSKLSGQDAVFGITDAPGTPVIVWPWSQAADCEVTMLMTSMRGNKHDE